MFSVLKQDLSTTILPFVGCMGGYVVRLCSYLSNDMRLTQERGNEQNWNRNAWMSQLVGDFRILYINIYY